GTQRSRFFVGDRPRERIIRRARDPRIRRQKLSRPPPIEKPPVRNPVQPGRDRRFSRERSDLPPPRRERFLAQVLGGMRVAGEMREQAVDGGVVIADELRARFAVARPQPLDQPPIVHAGALVPPLRRGLPPGCWRELFAVAFLHLTAEELF